MAENNFNKYHKDIIYKISTILLLIFEFAYLIIRAIIFPIIEDEGITFLELKNKSLFSIIIDPMMHANNHVLNTFFIKICIILFGNYDFVLRIPAIIGGFLFLFYTYRISEILYNKYFIFISTLFITLNPILLIYLALARGYSLGLGFMMASVYYFFKSIKKRGEKKRNNSLSIFFSFLATLSVMTFIYVLLAVTIFIIIIELRHLIRSHKIIYYDLSFFSKIKFLFKNSKTNLIIPIIINYIPFGLYTFYFILKMHASNEEYWGVKNFFTSLEIAVEFFICGNGFFFITKNILYSILWILIFILIFIFIIFLIYFSIILVKKNELKISVEKVNVILVSSLLFGSISMQFLHFFVHSMFYNTVLFDFFKYYFLPDLNKVTFKFVATRSGFFIYPLFSLFIVSLLYFLQSELLPKFKQVLERKNWKRSSNIKRLFTFSKGSIYLYFTFFLSILILNTINNVSFNSLHIWNYENSNREIANDLIELHSQYFEPTETMEVYVDYFLEAGLYYYREVYNMEWLDISASHWAEMNQNYDYYVLYDNAEDIINHYNLKIVKYYEISDVYLVEY